MAGGDSPPKRVSAPSRPEASSQALQPGSFGRKLPTIARPCVVMPVKGRLRRFGSGYAGLEKEASFRPRRISAAKPKVDCSTPSA